MAVGDLITAARYNAIQQTVKSVLGNGQGNFGYGQVVNSTQLVPTNPVYAIHMTRLKTDLTNIYAHQFNASPPSLPTVVSQTDLVSDAVYVRYETLAASLLGTRLTVSLDQTTTSDRLTSERTTSWGGEGQAQSIKHEFSVRFGTANARRHFFNSGGEIRFSPSITGVSGAKSTAWQSLLNSISPVVYNYNGTVDDLGNEVILPNTSITYNNSLTPEENYQLIYSNTGDGTYSDTDVEIFIRERRFNPAESSSVPAGSALEFKIVFTDGVSGVIDEPVNGTITSTVSELRATGQYVEVLKPAYVLISGLNS